MSQSRLDSFIEAWMNTIIGFILQYTASYIFLHAIGVSISGTQNFWFGCFMMVISFARQYTLRRFANKYISQVRAKMLEFFRKEVK